MVAAVLEFCTTVGGPCEAPPRRDFLRCRVFPGLNQICFSIETVRVQLDKLTTSIRYGSVGDIQANLERAERTQLIGRDGEGGSLLMHAAQRGETAVFGAVLDFLSEKLTVEEVSAIEVLHRMLRSDASLSGLRSAPKEGTSWSQEALYGRVHRGGI